MFAGRRGAMFDKAYERVLFRRLADGNLTAQEFSAVEQRLLVDAGFRERYVRAMGIEGGLYEAFKFPGNFSQHQISPVKRPTTSLFVFTLGGLSTTLLLAICGWVYWGSVPRGTAEDFTESSFSHLKPVAIVTQASGTANHLQRGTRIKPGVLKIDNGQVQIEFLTGAQINLEGPAELHVLSVDAAKLISGKAAARIPLGARGFILSTPDAAIVDLGTEFAVSVGKGGDSEVHVVEGEVDVSLLGSDGNTLISQRVREAKALRMTRRPPGLIAIDSLNTTLPEIQAQNSAPLEVSEAYVQLVRASRPDIYWRFESLVDGRVPNDVGSRWAGVIHADPDDPSGIVVEGGVVRFKATDKPRRVEPDEVIPGFNRESFSVELWASPDNFHWATLVAVVPEESVERNLHLNLLELPYKCSLVYAPSSFRFVHRYPPGTNGGTNLFTAGDCAPGLWHHLVAIKSPAGMKLYLNGKLIREILDPAVGDESPYRFYLGELYEGLTDRQLSGAIDEFAVYLRELTEDEVRAHYLAMISNPPAVTK
jgi:hypothetical protein